MGLLHKSGNLKTGASNNSYALLHKGTVQLSGSSREFDTARWTFRSEQKEMPNLVFMPIIAIIILIVCSLVKAYQWSQGRELWKAKVNVEFSEETEENVSSIGNRDFSPSENHSDAGSLYDTVGSFRLLENGYAIQLNEGHPYHDTVTSYKSLLMQKADGSQYDSVKSYKAFLQKVTQNKDLDVEVKLLENYPIRSKSVEHCVVLEELSSERSGEVTARLLGALPLKKQLHKDCRLPQFEKKKSRHRRASGDTPGGMRKRSASNPTCRRVANTVGSLPSVRYTVSLSSDSEEDTQQSFRMDRKKLWAERRKISRSASGGKIYKDTTNISSSNGHCSSGALLYQKKVRHFSADGTRYHRKAATASSRNSNNVANIDPDRTVTQKRPKHLLKAITQTKKSPDQQTEESSSENPASSDSSDSDLLSDAVMSDSDDDTKQNTHLSTASDDQTLDNDVFFSVDSGAELVSSSEILQNSPKRSLSETKILIARAKADFLKNKTSHVLMPQTECVAETPACDVDNIISETWTDVVSIPIDSLQTSNHDAVFSSTNTRTNVHSHQESESDPDLQSLGVNTVKSTISTGSHGAPEGLKADSLDKAASDAGEEPRNLPSPQKVQRFHVTHVNNDLSSPYSD
ncbi:hypothetical protein BsWGS_21461 [Bradybaena similaris]